ncbi:MAG: HEAT repeat domain-containing protein [Melioribacteraceae bacterium]
MKIEEELQKIGILKDGTAEAKIEVLNGIEAGVLSDKMCEAVADLIKFEDKGVRNAATSFILNNRNPKFPEMVARYITVSDLSIRNLAGEILINLGPLSVEPLITYHHQDDNDTLKFIIDLLGLIGDDRASLFILGILSATENDNVILACLEALGNVRFDGAVDVMILFYDRNELYKPTIVEALGKIGSKVALEFLVERFPNEDELTRYSIIESLGSLGDINTFFFLLEQMTEINGRMVLPLIKSLSALKEKCYLDIPFDNRMKNLLLYTIAEGEPEDKKTAFNLIDTFDDKDILCASLNLLGEDSELDELIRSKIYRNAEFIYLEIARLINQNVPNLKNILELFLMTVNYLKEFNLPVSISMMEIRNIVHAVSGLLNHHDEEMRKTAVEILFELDPETALLFIDVMSNDENNWNRLRLLEIIENIPGHDYDPVILKYLNDEDEMIRERAAYSAGIKNIVQLSTNVN